MSWWRGGNLFVFWSLLFPVVDTESGVFKEDL